MLVENRLTAVLGEALRLEVSDFSNETSFEHLGIDSIVSVGIVETLNQVLGTQLRPVDLFNYSTIRNLSERILSVAGEVYPPARWRFGCPREAKCTEFDSRWRGRCRSPPKRRLRSWRSAAWEDGNGADRMAVAVNEPSSFVKTVPNAFGSNSLVTDERTDSAAPIAVIGISGRFPGARDVREFWDNLAAGKDSVTEVPLTRWRLEEFYSPDREKPGRSYSKWGGFLSDIDLFDPLFFGISPHEAELMEPIQRLFLMESWKALEDAGYGNRELNGKRCGVFVGSVSDNYMEILRGAQREQEAFSFIGTSPAILSARIAYILNLKGPCLSIDTACSSSGVAIHLACESLRLGTIEMALAGGAALMSTPQFHVWLSQTGMLSPEGKCKTFDEGADGFVPGETVAVLALKRLADAVRDGDHIYGIIRGSGLNQDGKTNGITAPSGPSQTELEIEVYERFGIDPATISYIECHGTGTKLGDPIEIGALTDAFRHFTDKTGFCAVGSVKTNIGHTLTGSGVAGIIKVLLALKHGQLPPSLHLGRTNPAIDFQGSPFYVNRELLPWPRTGERARLAAVSAFGFSGTNAHLVIEEPPVQPPLFSVPKPAYLVTFSARTDLSLRLRLKDLTEWLEREEAQDVLLENISYTLNAGRSHFEKRHVMVVSSVSELRDTLVRLQQGEKPANAFARNSGTDRRR